MTTTPRSRLHWLPGSARGFDLPIGPRFDSGELSGYYIDFREKAKPASWESERWRFAGRKFVWVWMIQSGLGCYERYLAGEGEEWLAAAAKPSERLLADQEPDGRFEGGWVHSFALRHTHPLRPPWLSAMAQGEAASLLSRMLKETGDERFANAALAALEPMRRPTDEGGVAGRLDGGFFPQEYPTDPPSYVLNGAIFALWGCFDVAVQLRDPAARELFEEGTATLARCIDRFDTGSWSRYDLFPHRMMNLASHAYHDLHISQLRVLGALTDRPELSAAAERFESYGGSRRKSVRALVHKAVFRTSNPRNATLSRILPWTEIDGRRSRALILCYHAISETWDTALSVTPQRFERQVATLSRLGFRGVTFSEAVEGGAGRMVAFTFDDAYRSVLELAAPILARHGMPATVFVPTSFPDEDRPMSWPEIDHWLGSPRERELVPLTWEQLGELREGGWEIGSHTHTHPRLTELGDAALERELRDSRAECEAHLGAGCHSLAYPYGDHDDRVADAARRAGYEAAATLSANHDCIDDPYKTPRIGVYQGDTYARFSLKLSPLAHQLYGRAARDRAGT